MVTPEQLADWQLLVDTIQMGEWRPSIFDTPGQQAIVALPEMMAEILLLQEQVKLAKAQRDSLQSSCFELATKLTAAEEELEHTRTERNIMAREARNSTRLVDEATSREGQVLYLLSKHGQTDGAHHKAWVIDQVARTLLGDQYDNWIAAMAADGLTWSNGIVP